ncbi:MAG: Fis family transcriptional regulator [Deltaproteobacteria bacterium RIFCSPLOWO2_12_FULL_40_28]|nr:MAG: Fis family transcriptional regulator [Deltaproteobacteria bacterium RIFCSPHIGHO2_02_FULL_40_28]OGQ19866.1 MAG: Fis family transcriptional regulator [Deltaproteobacteria bacterium RIFCSPHIGHO2_12_FULL_40_32]OGQ39625.1 MAG: Fis family transcriptional regulator [Deltaproteobacteria bacterium RIFCSPLOWO2_02_FULL_40_36]OGQ52881.1 MAG: Fis family transcriptional regulator [Deltaproteobacteria bacterium RIFCSPLOWO2_12_FULL_40_28]
MKAKILVVDDEVALTKALSKYLTQEGYAVDIAGDGPEAIEKFKTGHFDLLLTDLQMPNMDGVTLIKEIKALNPLVVCIVMTGFASIQSAVEATKAGAFHYVTKPFELDDIGLLIKKALEHTQLKGENQILQKQIKTRYGFENIIGTSDELNGVLKLVQKVADTDSTVLILGESGTGKELIARAIHYNSNRADKPLVPVNCGAIPENLLESELFGHVKGSFTGAINSKMGRFEMANGGTIFLDEIGDMSLRLQVKILRVLQERKFEPVGSTKTVEVDVRIITATHRNLEDLVAKGEFREDLYYRLNVIPLNIPPLRERVSDIPILVDYFLKSYSTANRVKEPIVTQDIMSLLMNYKWPGNIRELENTIERLVVLRPAQVIGLNDLPDKFLKATDTIFKNSALHIPDAGISLKNAVNDFENTLILKALEKTGWNKNKAASLLRLNRTTLVEKIKKKQLEKDVH